MTYLKHSEIIQEETWKPIAQYETLYDISNFGRVRSWISKNGKQIPNIRTLSLDKDGYLFVTLYGREKPKGMRVARLVLSAFTGIKQQDLEASHIDGNKFNNNLDNLVWETRLQNEQRKTEHGTRPLGASNHFHRFTEQDVISMRKMRIAGKTLMEISTIYSTSETEVSLICRRLIWKHI